MKPKNSHRIVANPVNPWKTASFVALALAVGIPAPALAQSTDVIRFKDGQELSGSVRRQTYAGVEVSLGRGATRKLDWNEVLVIDWADSKAFDDAVDAAREGRIDAARNGFLTILEGAKLRRPLRQETLIRLARLEEDHGRTDDAIEHYRELLSNYPNGRYLDEAAEALIDGLIGKVALDDAAKSLSSILIEAKKADVDPRFDAVAGALRGRILEAKKSYASARAEYSRALVSDVLPQDIAARTRLGVARCLHAEGNPSEARTRYRALTNTDASNSVLAGAWNGLADLALDEGIAHRDRNQIEIALFSYLRGVVLYVPSPGERTTEHERAIRGAAQAFDYISQLETDPKSRRLAQVRALALRRRLEQR